MKVGFIFECGPKGPDCLVVRRLARLVAPHVTIEPVFLESKKHFFLNPPIAEEEKDIAKAAKALLEIDRCDKVIIMWDLHPPEFDTREDECNFLRKRLEAEDVDLDRVKLLCVAQMLETWLITDPNAIKHGASISDAHWNKPENQFGRVRHPEREQDPKSMLNSFFKRATGQRYCDFQHAPKIAAAMEESLSALRRICSFQRFEALIKG